MTDEDLFTAYATALLEHGDRPIMLELDVLTLSQLIAALQLSLRHPDFPRRVRPAVEGFVAATIDQMRGVSPVIARLMVAGNDPDFDVEPTR